MPKLGSASLREASLSVVLRAEGVTRRQSHRGREPRDNGIKHHIVQILRVRIHGRDEMQPFRLYFGTLGKTPSLGIFPRSPKTFSPEKDMARARWTDLTKRENKLEPRTLGQRQNTQRRDSPYLHQRCCMRSTSCVVTTKS